MLVVSGWCDCYELLFVTDYASAPISCSVNLIINTGSKYAHMQIFLQCLPFDSLFLSDEIY